MKPDRWRDWLNEYLDGELDAERRRLVEAGLAGDPEAARLLDELRRTQAALAALPRRAAPTDATASLEQRVQALVQALLAAYADDQLPPRWRARVEAWLGDRSESAGNRFQHELARLRAVGDQLESLPRQPAPPELLPGLLERLQHEASTTPAPSAGAGKSAVRGGDLLLEAYADGELGPEEREKVEQTLKRSRRARRRLAEIQRLSARLRELPRRPAPPAALDFLVARPVQAPARATPVRRARRVALFAGLSLAASVALVVIASREWITSGREVAVVQPTEAVWFAGPNSPKESEESDRLLRRQAGQVAEAAAASEPTDRLNKRGLAENRAEEPVVYRAEAEAADDPKGVDGLRAADEGALDALAELPAAELERLDQGTIRLYCREPARAGERLWIVLADNEVAPVRKAKPALRDLSDEAVTAEGAPTDERDTNVVDVELSAARLASVLRDLASAERGQPLFASVEIHRPGPNRAKDAPPSPATELAQSNAPKPAALLGANDSFLRPSTPANPPGADLARQADAAPAAPAAPPAPPAPPSASASVPDKAAADASGNSLKRSTAVGQPPPKRVRVRFVLEQS